MFRMVIKGLTCFVSGAILMFAFAVGPASAAPSLWASDSTDGTASFLYELDASTGAVLSTLPSPGVFADALSFSNDGQSIYVLDMHRDEPLYVPLVV